MLKKLKAKIIWINVLLCGVLLLGVVTAVCVNSYRIARTELENGLRAVLERDRGAVPDLPFPGAPGMKLNGWQLDSYTILTADADGTVLQAKEQNLTLSEEETSAALAYVLGGDRREGVYRRGGLMFVRRDTPDGIRVALSSTAGLRQQLFSAAGVGAVLLAGGLLVIVAISMGLASLAVRPVETAWQKQRQFVADASHELKTPLTVILANTGILLAHAETLDAGQRQWIASTDEEARRMKRMTEQLLELARADADGAQPVFAETDCSALAEECALCFEPAAYEKGMSVRTKIAPGVSAVTDREKLGQLIRILLDNAVKYGARDTEITCTLTADSRRAEIAVRDFGTVIPPDELPHLFDRFWRADRARGEGGFGLGLTIAQSIAGQLGASLAVSSSEKDGTCFTVSLPLAARGKS